MRFLFSPFTIAIGIIAGMIMGSGVFALPYAVNLSGIGWSSLSALVAFFAILAIHLAYGEIVANNPEEHRLPGYVSKYIGKTFGRAENIAQIFAFNAILLVYAILGGKFILALFGNASILSSLATLDESANGATVLFFVFAGAIFLFGTIRTIGVLNFVLTAPLVFATLWIALLALQRGSIENIVSVSGSAPFFSFSVFMFSLAGLSVIADAKGAFTTSKNLYDNRSGLRSAIAAGTALPLILYVIFIAAVLALSGGAVTEEALLGLWPVVGDGVVRVGALVGLLAVFTSYLVLGYDLRKIYELDMRIPPFISVALVIAIPFVFFVAGFVNFVELMSLVGGFFVTLDGIFVVFILRSMRRQGLITHPFVPFNTTIQVALVALFAASAIYELWFQAFK